MRTLLILVLFSVAVMADYRNDPNNIVLPVVVHDYFPCRSDEWTNPPPNGRTDLRIMDNCQPDVEPYQTTKNPNWGSGLNNANLGMVKNTLGANRKPIYAMGPAPGGKTNPTYQTQNSDSYNRWWDSSWPGNFPISYNFTLNLDPKTGLYGINTNAFYPIDNQGWGNNGVYPDHNWGFCVEAHAAFIYNSSAVLSFQGDDDMWIFMNNQLVFDIGGIHTPASLTRKLGDFAWATPMVEFGSYPFDMFYCERQSAGSNIILTTTVNIYCPDNQYDACGVCQGKGDCCPQYTNPDKCVISTLNPRNCQYINDTTTLPAKCAAQNNQCYTFACDSGSGNCVPTAIPPPAPVTGCQLGHCDNTRGWVITANNPCPSVNQTCFPSTCTPNTTYPAIAVCTNTTQNQCLGPCGDPSLQCPNLPCSTVQCVNNANAADGTGRTCHYTSTMPADTGCFKYSCGSDNITAIASPAVNCSSPDDLCYTSTCNATTGKCTPRVNVTCDNTNKCTVGTCVPATGNCTYTPVPLPSTNDTCISSTCDPVYGISSTDIPCKGVDCQRNSTMPGCCYCRGFDVSKIVGIAVGVVAGATVGAVAGAAILGFGSYKAYDYFSAGNMAAGGVQNNPMYVANEAGGANPMYDANL